MTRQEAIKTLEDNKSRQTVNVAEAIDVVIDAAKRFEKIAEIVHTVTSCEDCAYEVLYYVDTKRDIDL